MSICHYNEIIQVNGGGKLFLGNIWAAEEVSEKNVSKVKAVLTVASNTGMQYDPSRVNHKVIEALDQQNFSLAPRFDEGVAFINENISKGNVLVHCFAGVSRSTSLVIAYLLKYHNFTYNQAEDLCRLNRPIIGPNDGFVNQLKLYESQIAINKRKVIKV